MFAIKAGWEIEDYISVIKIVATSKLSNISIIDDYVQSVLINKIVELIYEAERFEGKALDVIPEIPKNNNTLILCVSISFNSHNNKESFKKQLEKILKQG